jgi:hypothetical protein
MNTKGILAIVLLLSYSGAYSLDRAGCFARLQQYDILIKDGKNDEAENIKNEIIEAYACDISNNKEKQAVTTMLTNRGWLQEQSTNTSAPEVLSNHGGRIAQLKAFVAKNPKVSIAAAVAACAVVTVTPWSSLFSGAAHCGSQAVTFGKTALAFGKTYGSKAILLGKQYGSKALTAAMFWRKVQPVIKEAPKPVVWWHKFAPKVLVNK